MKGNLLLKAPERVGPEEAVARGSRAVDHHTGIISRLFEHMVEPDDIDVFFFTGILSDTSRFLPRQCHRHNGGCSSLSKQKAKAAAICECFERYCAGTYRDEDLICDSYKNVADRAVSPDRFVLFSQNQYKQPDFRFTPFSREAPVRWVEGYSLTEDRTVLIPASFVYTPYTFLNIKERFRTPISTGLACGNSIEEAILMGLYEVVERDALMITWLNRLSPPLVDVESIDDSPLQDLIARHRKKGVKAYLADITTDLSIPTFLALTESERGNGAAVTVGSASRVSPKQAMLKALEESAHARNWVKIMMRTREPIAPTDDFSFVQDFPDHPFLYGHAFMLPQTQFIRASQASLRFDDLPDPQDESILSNLRYCLRVLADKGYDVIAVDITSPDVADLGFSVVRVAVPELQPISVEVGYRCLGGNRLYEVPVRLGHRDRPITEEEINPYPHPLP